MKDLLFKLCDASAVSGNENKISELLTNSLSKYGETHVYNDGSVICELGNKNAEKTILFDAHIDQIGLIVTYITEEGFIKVAACGGVDKRLLPGSVVTVHGKKDLKGVVCNIPPHLSKSLDKEEFVDIEDTYIDLGLKKEEVKNNVNIGDSISFYGKQNELLNERVSSPCLDDRSGASVLIKLTEKLHSSNNIKSRVFILLSSQEETGSLGAKISSYRCNPDEAIAVDVSFAKQPNLTCDKYSCLGKGGMIGIAPILSNQVTNTLINIAKNKNIPYQLEVMGGKSGTNADVIATTKSGVKCGLVSVPQRYMHSTVEVVDIKDLNNIVELLFEYVLAGGAKD